MLLEFWMSLSEIFVYQNAAVSLIDRMHWENGDYEEIISPKLSAPFPSGPINFHSIVPKLNKQFDSALKYGQWTLNFVFKENFIH